MPFSWEILEIEQLQSANAIKASAIKKKITDMINHYGSEDQLPDFAKEKVDHLKEELKMKQETDNYLRDELFNVKFNG